jgi:ABC-type transporter Mla subunit MlaD
MSAERSEKSAATANTAEFDGEIRDLIRNRDVTYLRSTAKTSSDVGNLAALIQRVSGGSTGEIDALITQLQEMRDYLRDEADRIRYDIEQYVQVSHAARQQVEMLSDHLSRWRPANGESPPVAVTHD